MLEIKKKYHNGKEPLYDTSQVAEKLGISLQSVRQFTRNYKLGDLHKVPGQKRKIRLYNQGDINIMKNRKNQVGKRYKG